MSKPLKFPTKKLIIVLILFLAIPAFLYLIAMPTNFFNKAFGRNANLLIDMGGSYDVQGEVWRNLAQGGEEKGAMLTSVVEKIRSLKPNYIRIDHIYDYYDVVGRDASSNLVFNWAKLDLTVKDIISSGALPFFNLSYMPAVLTTGSVTDLPIIWEEWETLVQKTVEHYSGKNGLNLDHVYYEVWNEPDLFGDFKAYGSKNYLELYRHTVIGASRANNVKTYKIGGPATTALYQNWLDSFLKFTEANKLRVDFFSWHKFSKELSDYENDLILVREWLTKYPNYANLELIISEIGPDSDNNVMYDNNLGAIHTLATSAVLENEINKAFTFEIKDGPGNAKLWGRWGILTHEKFGEPSTKPRFEAIDFLNKMKGFKVNVAGEGSWVKAFAKEEVNSNQVKGTVRIMIVNYDPGGGHYEAVPINLINLQTRRFIFRRINFSGATEERLIVADTDKWSATEGFKANSAAIFEIIPKW